MNKIDLSLIIACYNEMDVIEESVKEIKNVLDNTRYTYEIIFVDDKSIDGTVEFLKNYAAKNSNTKLILHKENTGRGGAVTDGIRKARGRIVGFIDIDLETPARYIPSLVQKIDKGYDIAIAIRIYKFYFRGIIRWILSKGYIFLVRKLLKISLQDTETGCKFFNREKILKILDNVEDKGWFWDTEIIARAYWDDFKIAEVPTLFIRRFDSKSKLRLFKDTVEYFIKLVKFRKYAK